MDQVSICWSLISHLNCNHRSLILKVGTPLLILSLLFPTGFCSCYQRLGLVLWAVWEGLHSGSAAVGASWCAHVSWCCFESWHHIFPRSVSRERCRPGKYKRIVSVLSSSRLSLGGINTGCCHSVSLWPTSIIWNLLREGTSGERSSLPTSGPLAYLALSTDARKMPSCKQLHFYYLHICSTPLSHDRSVSLFYCRWVKWTAEHNGYLGSILRKALNSYLNSDMWVFSSKTRSDCMISLAIAS